MKTFLNKLYLPLIYLIGLINWTIDTNYLYIPLVVIVIGIVVFKNLKRIYLMPLMTCLPFAFKSVSINPFVIICYIIIMLLLSYDIYQQIYTEVNPIIKIMFLFLMIMILSLFYTLSSELTWKGILEYYFYLFILYYFYNVKDQNKKMYLGKSLIILSFYIFFQMIIYWISNIGLSFQEMLAMLDLGWGSYNLISLMYLILIPLSSYYYLEKKQNYYIIFIFFNISMVFIMMTRGSYLTLLLMAIPFLIQIYNDSIDKAKIFKQFLLYLIIALLFRLLISTPTGMSELWFKRINNLQISFTNNDLLFDLGIKIFKINPIFGNGANTSSIFLSLYDTKNFPNYLIETLATLGIIGLFILILYLSSVLKVTTGSLYNRYARYSFICIMIQGLLETGFYSFVIMVILSLILSSLDENTKGEASVNLLIE